MNVLYTDGGCSPNPGPGGWAFLLIKDGDVQESFGGQSATTNNRMELTAVIKGLEASGEGVAVELFADSEYVLKGLKEWMPNWKAAGWTRKVSGRRKPVLNVDLWQQLDSLASTREISCTWVKGHSGDPRNERCDELVNGVHDAFRRGVPVPE